MVRFLLLCLPFLQVKKGLLLYRDKGAKMATSYSVGHGVRRRAGNTPSSYTEAAGKSMKRTNQTHEEAMADAAAMGSPRATMSSNPMAVSSDATMSSVDELNAGQLQGAVMPKKNVQAGDPTGMGTKVNRTNIPYNEKLGASYRVSVPFTPTIDPAAGPTMQSARIVPSIQGRENPNFESGIQGASSF
jgi:hypothetical protein